MEAITDSIKKLHAMTEIDPPTILKALEPVEHLIKVSDKEAQAIGILYHYGWYEQAAITLIKCAYPDARYGFDYVPTNKPDKDGRDKFAQGWVRIHSDKREFNPIDWSISHKFSSIAMIIALLHVIQTHQEIKTRLNA